MHASFVALGCCASINYGRAVVGERLYARAKDKHAKHEETVPKKTRREKFVPCCVWT